MSAKLAGYAIGPTETLPKRWRDAIGPLRIMCEPCEGYVMARRPGAAPFVLSVRDLLSGDFSPILPKPRINVRLRIAEIEAAQEQELKEIIHGQ